MSLNETASAMVAPRKGILAVDARRPTAYCIETNADALGRYAALAGEAGLVPIVQPGSADGRRPRYRTLPDRH